MKKIHPKIDYLELGKDRYKIIEKKIDEEDVGFGVDSITKHYHFLTPWLALNERNYERYKNSNQREQIQLLKKILIGNILSMAKGLEYVITEEIKVEVDVRPLPVRLKGTPMIGFLGTFSVNFEIPDYWGIGKSVSRGFGTVKRVR